MSFIRYDFWHTTRQQTLRPNLTACRPELGLPFWTGINSRDSGRYWHSNRPPESNSRYTYRGFFCFAFLDPEILICLPLSSRICCVVSRSKVPDTEAGFTVFPTPVRQRCIPNYLSLFKGFRNQLQIYRSSWCREFSYRNRNLCVDSAHGTQPMVANGVEWFIRNVSNMPSFALHVRRK